MTGNDKIERKEKSNKFFKFRVMKMVLYYMASKNLMGLKLEWVLRSF